MNVRKKVKDVKLQRIKGDLEAANAATNRAYKRLRSAWGRFDRLMKRIAYLMRRQAARERELDTEVGLRKEATP